MRNLNKPGIKEKIEQTAMSYFIEIQGNIIGNLKKKVAHLLDYNWSELSTINTAQRIPLQTMFPDC